MEVEVIKMEVYFFFKGSWSCKMEVCLKKMEVEVVKMEVCFLKNGSWSYWENGSLFFEKQKLKL